MRAGIVCHMTLLDMGDLLPQEKWVTIAKISRNQRRFGCYTYFPDKAHRNAVLLRYRSFVFEAILRKQEIIEENRIFIIGRLNI